MQNNDLHFQRYKDVLDNFFRNKKEQWIRRDKAKNVGFRVYNQGVVRYEQIKLGLSTYYNKRYDLVDGIHARHLDF